MNKIINRLLLIAHTQEEKDLLYKLKKKDKCIDIIVKYFSEEHTNEWCHNFGTLSELCGHIPPNEVCRICREMIKIKQDE